jgi:hypothetical protein
VPRNSAPSHNDVGGHHGEGRRFQRGAPTTSKQVGEIAANWSQGSGTIGSGTAANKATDAALAAYPGGVVGGVVMLSNGEYNVHYIGVNWPTRSSSTRTSRSSAPNRGLIVSATRDGPVRSSPGRSGVLVADCSVDSADFGPVGWPGPDVRPSGTGRSPTWSVVEPAHDRIDPEAPGSGFDRSHLSGGAPLELRKQFGFGHAGRVVD